MEAVIFDMDDTLYKEESYRTSGYRTIARHYAQACGVSQEELLAVMAQDPTQAFERVSALAEARGIDVSVADQLTVYRSHMPQIQLDPVAEAVLTELKKRGVPMGLITDGRALGQLNKIKALQLDRFFAPNAIMPTVMYHTDKHSPKPFQMMEETMRRMGATRMCYVGDNPAKDFLHPNLRGWRTVMLMDPERRNIHPQRLEDWPAHNRPQTVIHSLYQIL